MVTKTEQPILAQPDLREQFADLEAKYRNDFDENGWKEFTDKLTNYTNDLHVGTRREYTSRVDNEMMLKYSGKDVERASMRLDFKRLYARKRKRYVFQILSTVGGLLTGIIGTWAFADISGKNPSFWPWVILLMVSSITIILLALFVIKDMEP
jgi:hypothetical protein